MQSVDTDACKCVYGLERVCDWGGSVNSEKSEREVRRKQDYGKQEDVERNETNEREGAEKRKSKGEKGCVERR